MKATNSVAVLLVEDHTVVRQSMRRLLESEGRCRVVGEARTGREAVELATTLKPDVILLDIALPVLNGLEATRQILAANPAAKVFVLSAYSDNVYVDRMTVAGAVGFLEKQTSASILIDAIHQVARGQKFFSPAIAGRMGEANGRFRGRDGVAKPNSRALTPRQTEVLQLVAEGEANKQIATTLKISVKTVEKHRQHLMEKLRIHHTAGLTRYAMDHGIIESRVVVTIV